MARSGFIVALLVGASLGLFFLLQVVSDLNRFPVGGDPTSEASFKAYNSFIQQASRADDSIFLLGAGKADITG